MVIYGTDKYITPIKIYEGWGSVKTNTAYTLKSCPDPQAIKNRHGLKAIKKGGPDFSSCENKILRQKPAVSKGMETNCRICRLFLADLKDLSDKILGKYSDP